MTIEILNSTNADIPVLFQLYEEAISYQKKVGNNNWQGFEEALICKEISEERHFKILKDGHIAGTFCITFSDPLIWHSQVDVPAIYIHRIATAEASRGSNLLQHIINWAKLKATAQNIGRIRIDTGSGNSRLIGYYQKNGFTLIGDTKVNYTPDLPAHYKDGIFTLLEMEV